MGTTAVLSEVVAGACCLLQATSVSAIAITESTRMGILYGQKRRARSLACQGGCHQISLESGRLGLDDEGMNIGFHQVPHRRIDEPVAGERRQAPKRFSDNAHPEMA